MTFAVGSGFTGPSGRTGAAIGDRLTGGGSLGPRGLDFDAKRVGIGGFSDGASYALSLGLANGDLFSRIFAFSPGFIREATPVGKPVIDVFHGTRDRILPIDATSRRIVPRLRRQGYDVTYVEFDGPHTVLSEHERVALARLAGG